ncbi:MAG: hypothetical protein Q7R83_03095 [bacterium]|nr:hypothetical protein [bacterium]
MKGKRVLLVEDEPDMRSTVAEILIMEVGCPTIGASSMTEGERYLSPLPDLVILDGTVNDGCTLPFVKILRDHGYTGIIIAHSSSQDSLKELMDAGCVPLAKGRPLALAALVRCCLEAQ